MTLSHPSKVEPGVGRVSPGLGIGVVENLVFLFFRLGRVRQKVFRVRMEDCRNICSPKPSGTTRKEFET